MESPSYIKSLLIPSIRKPQGRRVWSIDLEQVWLPFFTATNTQGDTAIPSASLGCPLRLGYDKTGAVRFTQAGRPVVRIAKELGPSFYILITAPGLCQVQLQAISKSSSSSTLH